MITLAPYTDISPGHYVPVPEWYFYVPAGTTQFAVYAPQRAYIPLHVRNASGTLMPCTNDASCSGAFLVFSVPPGQDGAVWSLDNFKGLAGPLRLLNVPNLLSPSPAQVLKPSNLP